MTDPEITDPRDPHRRDIVAELDRQLLHWHEPMLERARDEIVALRTRCAASDVDILLEVGRNEALEEATAVCLRKARDHVIPIGQDNYHDGCVSCAAAIRALKDEGQRHD